jgi:hypothetical protein
MSINPRKRVSSDPTDRKASAMKYQVVRVSDGKVLAGSTDRERAESTRGVLGDGYEVRERTARS